MNKESNWNDCIETCSSLSITPDNAKAKSLIDTAQGRIGFLFNLEIEEKSANYIFEAYYSSVLEILHSILLINGYKVLNHICLGYYLRDVMKKDNLFRLFDNCRYKQNSLIYYGRKMDFETAKDVIDKSKELINQLIKLK